MMNRRDHYLEKLVSFQDKPVIKVITGMRRSGKSMLMELFHEHLVKSGIPKNRIIPMNFESFEHAGITDAKALYEMVKSQIEGSGRQYILLDEVQMVNQWMTLR